MLFLKVHIALLVPFYRSFFFSSPAYILSKTGFIRKLPSCPENISECKAQKYISEHFPILLSHPESCGTKLWLFLLWAFGKMLFYNSFIRQPSSLQLSQILIPHWHCLQMSLSLLLGQIIVSDYTWSPFLLSESCDYQWDQVREGAGHNECKRWMAGGTWMGELTAPPCLFGVHFIT